MSNLIDNERTKLVAGALDRASTSCLTVGIATPLAALLYNIGNFGVAVGNIRIAAGFATWFLAAMLLHLMARQVLKGLKG